MGSVKDIYNRIEYKQREKPQDLNRFITKINRPILNDFRKTIIQ